MGWQALLTVLTHRIQFRVVLLSHVGVKKGGLDESWERDYGRDDEHQFGG